MATAQVKQLHAQTGRRVMVVGRSGAIAWSEVFEGNPKILKRPERNALRLINAGGVRPYIAAKSPTHWRWKLWDISPGELFLNDAERAFAAAHAGRILIEPNTKESGSNKAWIWSRWQELVDRGGDFIQVGGSGAPRLTGVKFVETVTFRQACAVLAVSRAFVGAEGGLHHAAAALGIPAVVLFSEFIEPLYTGYKTHRNLRHAGPPCGSRIPCAGCRESMEKISVDEVSANLEQLL